MDFEDDIQLNKFDLDNEWQKQPALVFLYGKEHAIKCAERDRVKEKLAVYRGDLELRIRNNPESYDLPKITEGAVTAAIGQDKSIRSYNKDIIELTEDINVLAVAVKAFEHKRASLDGLTKLEWQHYFSETPSTNEGKAKLSVQPQKKKLNENMRMKKWKRKTKK